MAAAKTGSLFVLLAAFTLACWLSTACSPSAFVAPKLPAYREVTTMGQRRSPVALQANPNFWGKIVPAEKRKPSNRPPYVTAYLLDKITRMNREGVKETVQTWDRECIIIPAFIGHTIGVHNGQEHVPMTVVEGMVGHRFKDFVPSYKVVTHPKAQKATKYSGR
mmetsp:Transcript_12197/g.28445  ORF Transcript_12197/g.28445 Transcript_12197/m.28445 type:complete len:164 (+) Transcript_12197:52-543(+)